MNTQNVPALPDDEPLLVPIKKVQALFGDRSRQWVYDKLRADANFPRPVRIGGYTIAWHLSEIRAYIAQLPRAELSGLSGPDQRLVNAQKKQLADAAIAKARA